MTYHYCIFSEIRRLHSEGHDDVLVSCTREGEEVWGELTALPREEMQAAIAACGEPEFTTEGMISGYQYLSLFSHREEE